MFSILSTPQQIEIRKKILIVSLFSKFQIFTICKTKTKRQRNMACGTSDALVWEVLQYENCCFRVKTSTLTFCRSDENVTGICDRKSCSLANSQYSTVNLVKGKIILRTKTAERAHMPSKLWDKIELPEDVEAANKIIDDELQYWDQWLIDKVKFRYTRLRETLIRQRELKQKEGEVKIMPIKQKIERRNLSREKRALKVAYVEDTVKLALKKQLADGVYDGVVNFDDEQFQKDLDEVEEPEEFIDESDFQEIVEEEEEELEKAE